jgi:pilus assembly protein CpaC
VAAFVNDLSTNDAHFEVLLGQGRILTLKESITEGKLEPLIAVGDPSVLDFVVINPRQIRIIGQRIGVTDFSVTTAAGKTYSFEVRVMIDLAPLCARLRCLFPDASLHLSQLRDQVVVEGQARDTAQVAQIIETIRAYLASIFIGEGRRIVGQPGRVMPPAEGPAPKANGGAQQAAAVPQAAAVQHAAAAQPIDVPPGTVPPPGVVAPGAVAPGVVSPELVPVGGVQSVVAPIAILNLIRVPTSHQVLLKVRVAELNRTALRTMGADILTGDAHAGSPVGTQIGGSAVSASALVVSRALNAITNTSLSPTNTAYGIFEHADLAIFLSALRRNNVLKILAEPNLVALNGHQATFLAGGEFPVPVPQFGGVGGAAATITVQFRQFGVLLGFLPFILDGDVIRLTVDPEVSEIDFSVATTLVPGGSPVPGLSSRKTHTTVEMHEGQTLMISGLMQLTLTDQTSRIPGLGDLPIIGPFFSNTTGDRAEKELVILVTPYLVEPMNPGQVPPTPGDEVKEPNDLELYFLNRIEARTGHDFRSTTKWDDPWHIRDLLHLESKGVCGPHGFAE